MQRVRVVDSHTAGEPTRVVVDGGPDLGAGRVSAQLERFRVEHDAFRAAVVNEPRGSDVLVGALLLPPSDPACVAGVVFFNNVGFLGMCGHGTIGVAETLAHLGRISTGNYLLETPVGVVAFRRLASGMVEVDNVPSRRTAKALAIDVPGLGPIVGDVAWGGNWFYLVDRSAHASEADDRERLVDLSWRIRVALNAQGHPEVDHVELFYPPRTPGGHSRNFVLCPGKAYDRSPCGTGTSAKLACLAADRKLGEGADWVQESIIGSRFVGRYRWLDRDSGTVAPTIAGEAFVNAEATLLFDPRDPFCWGIR